MPLIGVTLNEKDGVPDFEKLVKEGVRFVIIQVSQGNFIVSSAWREQYTFAKAEGLIIGLSYVPDSDSTCTGTKEANFFFNQVKGLDCAFYEIEFWKWWEGGLVPGTKVSGTKLDARMQLGYEKLLVRPTEFDPPYPVRPIVLATSKSFTDNYSPRTVNTSKPKKLLDVFYYPYDDEVVRISWENLRSDWMPEGSPVMLKGYTHYDFWRFTEDKFRLPYLNEPARLVLWEGSWNMLQRWAGMSYSDEPGGEVQIPLPTRCPPCNNHKVGAEVKVISELDGVQITGVFVHTCPLATSPRVKALEAGTTFLADPDTVTDAWIKYLDYNWYVSGTYLEVL